MAASDHDDMHDLVVPKEAREVFTLLNMTKVIDWLQAPGGSEKIPWPGVRSS